MSDAISKAIVAMDMARSHVGSFHIVVIRELTESIAALKALQSREPVGEVFEVLCDGKIAYINVLNDTALSHRQFLYTTPQPVADVNQQLVEALKACEECLTFIHGGEPLRTDVPLKLAREALLKSGVAAAPQPVDSIEGVVTGRDWRDRTLEVTFNTKVTLPKTGEIVTLLKAGKETV